MSQNKLCPMRKEVEKCSNLTKEYFLPCYENQCAWWNEEEGKCNLAKIV